MSARSRASRARSTEKYSVPRSVRDLRRMPGGVDEADRSLRGLHHGVHRVPGGAGGVVGDRPLVAHQPVEQGRLPDVGPADQGHPGDRLSASAAPLGPVRRRRRSVGARPVPVVRGRVSGSSATTSSSRSPVPRPCRALIGQGSPRPRAMASQASASRWDESTLLTTTRTGRPDRLSTRATARSSSMTPTVTSTTNRTTSASAMARSAWALTWASSGSADGQPPAGVDHGEGVPAPLGVELLAVAGDPGPLLDDGGPPAHDAVDQRRLAHVGPSGDDHQRPLAPVAASLGRGGVIGGRSQGDRHPGRAPDCPSNSAAGSTVDGTGPSRARRRERPSVGTTSTGRGRSARVRSSRNRPSDRHESGSR